MMTKILPILLTISLSVDSLAAAAGSVTEDAVANAVYPPGFCIDKGIECGCLTPQGLEAFADLIDENELMRFELARYKEFAAKSTEEPWQENSTMLVLSTTVAILFGGFVGYRFGLTH